MEKFASMLEQAGIPYIWLIFTDTEEQDRIKNPNLIYKKPIQDNGLLMGYVKEADYLVQFSNSEAYCYAVADSLKIGVPVLVTDCPVYKELGIVDGVNGYIFDFDLNNVDVHKIYNEIPSNFKFKEPEDNWSKWLVEGKSQYLENTEKMEYVVAKIKYLDIGLKRIMEPTDPPYEMNTARAEELEEKGFITRIEG